MKIKLILSVSILMLLTFTHHYRLKDSQKNASTRSVASVTLSNSEMIKELELRREYIRSWATECTTGLFKGQISDLPDSCDQGDVMLWSGISCLAAELARDSKTVSKRCLDVSLGKDSNGRWWRGQSRINAQTENSFSRDMMLGVISYFISQGIISQNHSVNQMTKGHALSWLNWIEYEGKGKKMCNDDKGLDNRCSILGSNILYETLKKMGAINSANAHFKTIKKLDKNKDFKIWYAELLLTKTGYQTHLKSIEIFQRLLLKLSSEKEYQTFTKEIYQKDKKNPWYKFLHLGPSFELFNQTLQLCPIIKWPIEKWTYAHNHKGTYFLQNDTIKKSWEIANGHDCMSLINVQIAALKQRINIPAPTPQESCGKMKQLGKLEEKNICLALVDKDISRSKCFTDGGREWKYENAEYCLINKSKYYIAKMITKTCPTGHTLVGEHNGLPLCHNNHLPKVAQHNCMTYNQLGSAIMPSTGTHKWCYINKGQWFQRRELGDKCPIGLSFDQSYVWNTWPVCRGITKIKKSQCTGQSKLPEINHCRIQEDGWFHKKNYKTECPLLSVDTGMEKDGNPICRQSPHFKIAPSKCNTEGGSLWQGWCIWNKGDYFMGRSTK